MRAKKLIAVLISALMLAGALPAMASSENKIYDTFDLYEQTANEGGWGGNGVLRSEDANKSVIIGNGNGDRVYKSFADGFSKDVTGLIAKFSIKFNTETSQHVIFGASSSSEPVAATARMIQFNAGGSKMSILSDKDIPFAYTTGIWYDVVVEINYNTGYYFLKFYDGTTEKTWTIYDDRLKKDETGKANAKIYSFWIASNSASESVQIDNVDIFGTTDDRIYPKFEEVFSFESYVSESGVEVPAGFESGSTLSSGNGFFGDGDALKFVSGTGYELGISKTLTSSVKPANIQIRLGDLVNGNFVLKIYDSSENSESVEIENASAGDIISATLKGGKLTYVFAGLNVLTNSVETTLADVKKIEILSGEECESNFEIENIKVKSCTFPELLTSFAQSLKPDTNEITLTFSNDVLKSNAQFTLSGDREIESIVYSGKSVKLTLDDNLSPNTEYTLSFEDILDIEGNLFSETIKFKTDLAISVNSFVLSDDGTENRLTADLVSNTGVNKKAKIILASFDKTTGKINETTDFLGIDITPVSNVKILKIAKTDNETVEAYIWEDFYDMASLSDKYKDMGEITLVKAEFDDEYLTLSGKFEKGSQGDKVLLQIYDNDADIETLKTVSDRVALFNTIDYLRQIELDEKGEFSIKVLLSGVDNGFKNIKVSSCGNTLEFKNAFLHASAYDVNAFVNKVSETQMPDNEFSNYFVGKLDFIGEEDSEYKESTNKIKILKELFDIRDKVYGGFENSDEIKKSFNMAMLSVNATSAENAGNAIALYAAKSILADESFYEYYDLNKEAVLAKIGENLPESDSELFAYKLYKLMGETLIFSAIKNVSTYTKIPEILNDNAKFLELDLSRYNALSDTSSIDKELTGFSGTLSEFYEVFSSLVDLAYIPKSTPKPQGGGGGRGGSVSSAVFEDASKTKAPIEYFSDLSSAEWARESVNALAQLSVVSGSGNGKYEPDRNVTREEFVKMAIEAFYRVDNSGEDIFADVTETDWSYPYVSTAFKKGFIKGINDNEFGKGMSITREDAAVILARIYGETSENDITYNDNEEISPYALSGVKTLTSLKVFTGNENGYFMPKKSLTRAECAKVIYTLYQALTGGE